MIRCKCRYDDKYVIRYAYNFNEFDFNKLNAMQQRKSKYIELPATLDIESSTIIDKDKSKIEGKPIYTAFMYHWQICVEGYVIFGRRWEQLIWFIGELKKYYGIDEKRKLVIYIHNLSYEFHFMFNFFNMTDVFATEQHKVLRATIAGCIELRCSYRLTNMSLAKFIENTPNAHYQKAKGDLDYSKVYTPNDELTEIEYGYCYNDVRGLFEAVTYKLNDDSIDSIPMTSTGYIRRRARRAMRKNPRNRKKFLKMKLTVEQLTLLQQAFRGGNTAGNRYLTNLELTRVRSFDITSSYPYVMMVEKYPMEPFMQVTINNITQLERYNREYCTVGRYIFVNLKVNEFAPIPYIPFSKCIKYKDPEIYNGRILSAEMIEIALTNVDFDIIKSMYTYDELYVHDFNFALGEYLPDELRNLIMELYYLKTTLKYDMEKAYEYMCYKADLNSTYGMMVTNILHMIYEFKDGEYTQLTGDPEEQLEKFYKNRNNFLSYQWGVWITAYARRNLQRAIDGVGIDTAYCDTDSVKFIGEHEEVFIKINNEVIADAKKKGINISVEFNGKVSTLGVFDNDGNYEVFKTLGAKKYCYIENGKLGVTVAGLGKKAGAEELEKSGGISAFEIGKVFTESGRTVAYYNNDPIHTIKVNGCEFLTASNIAIVPTTYTLGITDQVASILERIGNLEYNN